MYPKGHTEAVERQLGQVQAALYEVHKRQRAGLPAFSKRIKDTKKPLMHDILVDLGVLKSGGQTERFEEDPRKIEQGLIDRGAEPVTRRASVGSESDHSAQNDAVTPEDYPAMPYNAKIDSGFAMPESFASSRYGVADQDQLFSHSQPRPSLTMPNMADFHFTPPPTRPSSQSPAFSHAPSYSSHQPGLLQNDPLLYEPLWAPAHNAAQNPQRSAAAWPAVDATFDPTTGMAIDGPWGLSRVPGFAASMQMSDGFSTSARQASSHFDGPALQVNSNMNTGQGIPLETPPPEVWDEWMQH